MAVSRRGGASVGMVVVVVGVVVVVAVAEEDKKLPQSSSAIVLSVLFFAEDVEDNAEFEFKKSNPFVDDFVFREFVILGIFFLTLGIIFFFVFGLSSNPEKTSLFVSNPDKSISSVVVVVVVVAVVVLLKSEKSRSKSSFGDCVVVVSNVDIISDPEGDSICFGILAPVELPNPERRSSSSPKGSEVAVVVVAVAGVSESKRPKESLRSTGTGGFFSDAIFFFVLEIVLFVFVLGFNVTPARLPVVFSVVFFPKPERRSLSSKKSNVGCEFVV